VEGVISAVWFDGEGVGDHDSRDNRCPTATRAYELRAEGPGGTDTESVTVVVIQPSPSPEDMTGPSITNVYPTQGRVCTGRYCGGEQNPTSIDISATVTDQSGVSAVQMYCIYFSGATPQPEQYCGNFTKGGGNNWVMTYTPPGLYRGFVNYRIRATDNSPGSNVSWWGTGYIEVYELIG